jgi:hypothetical protein
MLPYDQNCVAMAFSRVLGIGVYATVNLFIARGWAATANALQYDETIQRVVDGLPLTQRALNTAWQDLRTQLSNLSDGRYFAVNNGIHEFGGRGVGHAFAIIKQGGWGTAANNSERTGYNYGSTITNSSNISVWGPA